jgi:hypothetical protein
MKSSKRFPFAFLSLVFLAFSACKKSKNECGELPAFGICNKVAAAGNLSQTTAAGSFVYKTNGGGTITITEQNSIVITHDNYPGFKLEYWGDAGVAGHPLNSANHENLNGKHIKDRVGSRRTIIFPDGTKITTVAAGEVGAPISISIYEGAQAHHINANCNYLNVVEYSAVKDCMTKQLDDAEADGETATFEFVPTGLLYVNIYTEVTPGNKVMNRVPLGEIERNNPTLVRDYYDDLRLGHT